MYTFFVVYDFVEYTFFVVYGFGVVYVGGL